MPFYNATPTRFELWGAVVVVSVASFFISGTNRGNDATMIAIQKLQLANQVMHLENQKKQIEIIEEIDKRLSQFNVNQEVHVERPRTKDDVIESEMRRIQQEEKAKR